jgi:hypothetical protein
MKNTNKIRKLFRSRLSFPVLLNKRPVRKGKALTRALLSSVFHGWFPKVRLETKFPFFFFGGQACSD